MKQKFLFLYLFSTVFQIFAQPAVELESYRKKYSDDVIIYLKKERIVDIKIIDNKLSLFLKEYEERFLLEDKANMYSENSVEYSGFAPLLQISAKTLAPEGKKYRTIEVKDFKTNDVMDGAIFHDDTKEKTFIFPALEAGAKTILEYEKEITEPRFLGAFFFGSYVPIENAVYQITAPESVELGVSYFNITEQELGFTKVKNKDKITYTWTQKNIGKLKIENNAPDIRYFIPHIAVYIKSATIDGKKEMISSSTDDLHNWYYNFIKNLDSSKDEELKKITDSLVFNITDTQEKVKRIYYWVQSNIKYVAFEEGMNGFIPRQAALVCQKRYGDCKDLSNIITEMLNMAGIEAHLTWIGSRDIPYKYSEIPTPLVDNHMIVSYKTELGYSFLDATEEHLAFGYPSSFIQGKEALINLEKGHFEISTVPIVNAQRNKIIETITLNINENKIIGTGTDAYTGYFKSRLFRYITGIKESEYTKYLANTYTQGNNTFALETFTVQNLYERDKPLEVNYDFNLRDYSKSAGNEIFINLNLEKLYISDRIAEDRILPIEKEFNSAIEKTNILNIPKGFEVEYLPKNEKFTHPLFGFEMIYSSTETQVQLKVTYLNNHLMLEAENFNQWNEMISALNKAYSEVVILKKK